MSKADRLHPEAPKVEIGQRIYFATNHSGDKSWVWEMFKARMTEGEVRLPSDRELLDDFRFISYDEASNITDEQIERLNHWAHRNILSAEERDRIYGIDLSDQRDRTVEVTYNGKRVINFNELPHQPSVDEMLKWRDEITEEFYKTVFPMLTKPKDQKDQTDANAD